MKNTWQLQEAKNQLSTVVERAMSSGPQTITKHGKHAVVVLSAAEFKRMRRPKKTLVQLLRDSPLRGLDLDFSRLKDPPREVHL